MRRLQDLIERIYRALFVYSVGFHDILSEVVKHSFHALDISGTIWIMFLHLLEAAEQSRYQMVMAKVDEMRRLQLKEKDGRTNEVKELL